MEKLRQGKDVPLAKKLLETVEGFSPLVCRELAFRADGGRELPVSLLEGEQWQRLQSGLELTADILEGSRPVQPVGLFREGKALDFSFFPILQYGPQVQLREYESCGALLDDFFSSRDLAGRMHARSLDLSKFLTNAVDRVSRKLAAQRAELEQSGQRETLKLCGDLLSANLYRLQKGQKSAQVENYYEEGAPLMEIPLDERLTPVQNAQKYYQEYRKAQTAEKMLTRLIGEGEEELAYLRSVQDLLGRAATLAELEQLREELAEGRYIRRPKKRDKTAAKLPPKRYRSSDGFTILVGRNNLQNDRLTLKESRNYDMWLHVKNIPGSHTIVVADGRDIPDTTLTEAAIIAAVNSQAASSAQVPVDYTQVRNIKKPAGAKPGMVIYHVYQTAYVTPDARLAQSLLVE